MIVFIMFSHILDLRFLALYAIRYSAMVFHCSMVRAKDRKLHAACIRPVATEVGDVYVKIKGHPKEAMTVGC